MTDRDLKLLATVHCKPYTCEAKIYVEPDGEGHRQLVAQYGDGYSGRNDVLRSDGRREFITGIPDDMSEQEIVDVWLLLPMDPDADYPKWEVPARVYGSVGLFRWWAGEKAY